MFPHALVRCYAGPHMSLPRSIVIPALLALAVALLIGGFLVWQLDAARTLLQRPGTVANETGSTVRPLASLPIPVEHGDAALTALRRGDLLALRGEWPDAEKEYRTAVDAGGGLTALRKLAQAQLQRRNIDGARETLRAMRSAGARTEDLVLLESIIDLRSGSLEEARHLLTEATDTPQKQYGLGLLAIVEGRHDNARAALSTVLGGWEPTLRGYAKALLAAYEEYDLFEGSPETHRQTLLARALADVGECELALPMLSKVLLDQDDYRDAWIVQGYCQLTTERMDEAKLSLERAYAIDPQKPEIPYFLARTFSKLGDHQAAITYLQYAIENGFAPASEAQRLLAAEALATGDGELALKQLDELTLAEGAAPEAFGDFIAAALSMDKKEEAYAKAQAAVAAHPTSAVAHDLLGWTALETGRKDEARTELTKALELDPSLESARQRLGSL